MKAFFILIFLFIIIALVYYLIVRIFIVINNKKARAEQARLMIVLKQLRTDAFKYMGILQYASKINNKYDDCVDVKSKIKLNNYQISDYIKADIHMIDNIKQTFEMKNQISTKFKKFDNDNPFKNNEAYPLLKAEINRYISLGINHRIQLRYISSRTNNLLGVREIIISPNDLHAIEININSSKDKINESLKKKLEKQKLDEQKNNMIFKIHEIMDEIFELQEKNIIKSQKNLLDTSFEQLYNEQVIINKIKTLDSKEWDRVDKKINNIKSKINNVKTLNENILSYYESNEFSKVKESCKQLMDSKKDFNEYINEKVESIKKLFGLGDLRNETKHDNEYKYNRKYEKIVSPFAKEVSRTIFSSAENNPIEYVIKYFYEDRNEYEGEIEKLKSLLNELETLNDAKQIINNYKLEFDEYLKEVPKYVLENDEDAFYSRLGFATIDESVLNFEYIFSTTTPGGTKHDTFSVKMNEETISKVINKLQDKLSSASLAKEQRALMTTKLRQTIKERDNYTCCICGNSTQKEPNLLLEIDHKIPVSKGGLTIEGNLQTLCWKCNRSKSNKII